MMESERERERVQSDYTFRFMLPSCLKEAGHWKSITINYAETLTQNRCEHPDLSCSLTDRQLVKVLYEINKEQTGVNVSDKPSVLCQC